MPDVKQEQDLLCNVHSPTVPATSWSAATGLSKVLEALHPLHCRVPAWRLVKPTQAGRRLTTGRHWQLAQLVWPGWPCMVHGTRNVFNSGHCVCVNIQES